MKSCMRFVVSTLNFINLSMQSTYVQAVVTILNVCVMLLVIIAGGYLGFKTGWVGYSVSSG